MMKATPALEPLVRQGTIMLPTYRRDGTPVGIPVKRGVCSCRPDARPEVPGTARSPDPAHPRLRGNETIHIELSPAEDAEEAP